jgi:hypothetical protein
MNGQVNKVKESMSGIELFTRIKSATTFAELLQKVDSDSKKGNVFEKVCDLIIKFGFCPSLPNESYDHYDGNANLCKLNKVDNLEIYLQKQSVLSKGNGGYSDITLQHKTTGKWVFISSKFY